MSVSRIVVSGYYGFGNLGDEAILATIVQQLGPQADVVVLSADPARTALEHGVRAVGRTDMAAIVQELRGAGLFLSGGGGLMQDVTGPFSVAYYGGLLKMAQWLGVPSMVFGQGVGPLGSPFNRLLVKAAFSGTRVMTVRDQASVDLLQAMRLPRERVVLTADPVLCLEPADPGRITQIWAGTGLRPDLPTIGISVRPWHTWYERQFKVFSTVISHVASSCGAQVLLLPFQQPGDERITEELRDCLSYRPDEQVPAVAMLHELLSAQEMLGLIGRLDMVVAMRLHAVIMAAASGVPAVGIAYDPKVAHFSAQWGFPVIPSVEALEDAAHLETTLMGLWRERHAFRARMQDAATEIVGRAKLNFEHADRILGLRPEPQRV
ncbi:colanic acid biosynthesis protein [compost metagenome]